jgi:hypothetical protein
MNISDYGVSDYVDPLMKELETYDLFRHVVELEAYGMTVVPPGKMQSAPRFAERLRDAILRTCEKRNGVTIGDWRTAAPPGALTAKNSWLLLQEDEVFVEAALNPVQLALVRWLCGQSAVLTGHTWIIKAKGAPGLGLHSDAHGIPPGGGHIAHMCNASWLCTDYEAADDGPTVFVPGSHRYGRATLPHEADLASTPLKTFPLVGKAGSLAIWHGSTWHGSVPRQKDGLRVTLVQTFMRMHMRPIHIWEGEVSPQLIQKYPALEQVLGKHLYPYRESNDRSRIAPFMRTGTDPFA